MLNKIAAVFSVKKSKTKAFSGFILLLRYIFVEQTVILQLGISNQNSL
jgi:hypothetical protein